jgi:hypothetical protein
MTAGKPVTIAAPAPDTATGEFHSQSLDETLVPDLRAALTPSEQIEGRLLQSLRRAPVTASLLRSAPVRRR